MKWMDRDQYYTFRYMAMLNMEEDFVLASTLQGWSIVKQAMVFGMSASTVSRIRKRIQEKYNNVKKKIET